MQEQVKLFHHNTLASLMSGLYEGTIEIGDLLKNGSFGIGTLAGVDGELIVLDGNAYIAKGNRTVRLVSADEKAPYAAVTTPHVTIQQKFDRTISDQTLLEEIEKKLLSRNLFHSVKVHGLFNKMHVRMSPGAKEGEQFVDVAARQPEYTEENISGTIVGYWTPELFHGMSVAGFHLHFISDDRQFGGHIMDFTMANGNLELGKIDQVIQNFPVEAERFLEADLDLEKLRGDIEKAE
ncbi:acetolactate decarboxylase [Lactococcus fujiensis]|uniref:Alpha-acetolactate decarboxylase n=1 Tax=Lactococcus fujiensis JCM 16395 TaxID=1291764 RepID=A0A2A5RJD8_9LACT|nr:acetolactate decarboxylase [Lactococcus fujiensis]PCR99238.1 alpha-acetolactate decarboxylase [Lactococcus fujiensis JCM 16395]